MMDGHHQNRDKDDVAAGPVASTALTDQHSSAPDATLKAVAISRLRSELEELRQQNSSLRAENSSLTNSVATLQQVSNRDKPTMQQDHARTV